MGSFGGVKHWKLRGFLVVSLLFSSFFAVWTWVRPYSWDLDPAARCKVVGAEVRRDLSYFWLDLHLKVKAGQIHDFAKPVRLVTGTGLEHEAADMTMAASDQENRQITDLWFKFWLEKADLEGPLRMRINDGTLVIKANSGLPDLGDVNSKFYATNHW